MPDVSPYDALLLVSFGGPEKPEDVLPFLENVTRGRGIPRERLEQVGEHYHQFGGRSPINDLNRELLAAIRADLGGAGIDLPVYWGNRNWDPYLTEVLARMEEDGVTRAACFVTSAYSSWSGCRQYRENLYDAVAPLGDGAPRLDKLRHYFNHPGLVEPVAEAVVEALAELPEAVRAGAHLVFVTHSIPTAMNLASGPDGGAYVEQHLDVSRAVDGPGRRGDRAQSRARPGLLLALRTAVDALAGAGRQRPPHPGGRRRRAWGGDRPRRLRLRPHGGRLRPRHRGIGDRARAGAAGRARGDAAGRRQVRGDGAGAAARAGSGRARRAGGASEPRHPRPPVGRLPGGCCPNAKGDRPALCGADS